MNSQRTILVVDDDGDLRESLRVMLENAGYRVEEASSSSEVVEKGAAVDMILLDLKLDGPDGKEALEELRRRKVWTPVVILTGAQMEDGLEDRLKRLKIVALITKGGTFSDLSSQVLSATKDKLRTRQAIGSLRETNAMLDECMRTVGVSGLHRAV